MNHRTVTAALLLGGMVVSGLAGQAATSRPATAKTKMKTTKAVAPQVETATFALG